VFIRREKKKGEKIWARYVREGRKDGGGPFRRVHVALLAVAYRGPLGKRLQSSEGFITPPPFPPRRESLMTSSPESQEDPPPFTPCGSGEERMRSRQLPLLPLACPRGPRPSPPSFRCQIAGGKSRPQGEEGEEGRMENLQRLALLARWLAGAERR